MPHGVETVLAAEGSEVFPGGELSEIPVSFLRDGIEIGLRLIA
jgi:hypothetical protein